MKKELRKKILLTIGLGCLIAIGIWFLIVQSQFIIRNFINDPFLNGPISNAYINDYVLCLIGQFLRIIFIICSLILLSFIVVKIWRKNKKEKI